MASRLKELEAQYTAQQKQPQPPTSSAWDRLRDLGSRALGAIVTALDAPSNFFRAKAQEAANEAQKRYEQLRKENPNRLTIKSAQDVKTLVEMKDYGRKAVAYGFLAGVASIISPSAWADTLRLARDVGARAAGAGAYALRDPKGALQRAKEEALKIPQYAADFGKGLIDRPFHAGATAAELMGSIITPVPFASKVPVTITRSFKADITGLKAFSTTGDYLALAKPEPSKLSRIDPLEGWGFTWGHRWLEDYGYYNQPLPIRVNLDLTLKDVMRLQPKKLESLEPRGTLFVLEGKLEPKGLPKIVIGRSRDADLFASTPDKFLYFHKEVDPGRLNVRVGIAEEHMLRLQALDLEAGLGGGRFRSLGFVGEFLPDRVASWREAMESRLAKLSDVVEPKAIREELAQAKLEHEHILNQLALETKLSQALNDPVKAVSKAEDLLGKLEAKGGVILAGELREPDRILHISRSIEEITGYVPKLHVKTQLAEKPVFKEGDVWGLGIKTTVTRDNIKDVTELYVVAPEKVIEKYIPAVPYGDAFVMPARIEPSELKPVKSPKLPEKPPEPPENKLPELGKKLEEPPKPKLETTEARAQAILKAVEERAMKTADEVELPVARLELPVPRGRVRANTEAPRTFDDARPWMPEKTLPEEIELPVMELPQLRLPRLGNTQASPLTEASPAKSSEETIEERLSRARGETGMLEHLPILERTEQVLAPKREVGAVPEIATLPEVGELKTRETGIKFKEQEMELLPKMLGEATLLRSLGATYEELKEKTQPLGREIKTLRITTASEILPVEHSLLPERTRGEADLILKQEMELLPILGEQEDFLGLRAAPAEASRTKLKEKTLPQTDAKAGLREAVGLESKPLYELSLKTSPVPRPRPVLELLQPEVATVLPSHVSTFSLSSNELFHAASPVPLLLQPRPKNDVPWLLQPQPETTSLPLYSHDAGIPRLALELIQPETVSFPWLEDIPVLREREKERKTRGVFVSREPLIPRLELGLRDFEFSLTESALEEPEERRRRGRKQERGKGEKVKAREYMLPEFLGGLGRF